MARAKTHSSASTIKMSHNRSRSRVAAASELARYLPPPPSTSVAQLQQDSKMNQVKFAQANEPPPPTTTRRSNRPPAMVTIPTGTTTITTSGQQQLDAVIIRDLTYAVGRGANRKVILNGIDLTVPEGSIYGLLGPSGCGKTTMLKCIVGRIWPKSGSVLVFGLRPGGGLGEVPGRDVGYMPQEISIYEDFTIEETLRYFGKINRLPTGEIRKRIEFLLQFLDLPSKKRLVANLSGGQKRRVSLAAALVHSPPLLILDEPTVGVDPLLRQNIWRHLVAMTKHEKISVIITTHYIEEARLANAVGLMRNGRILAEASPDELMHEHQLTNLEDVFLKLCVTDSTLAQQRRESLRLERRRQRRSARASAPSGAPLAAPVTSVAAVNFLNQQSQQPSQDVAAHKSGDARQRRSNLAASSILVSDDGDGDDDDDEEDGGHNDAKILRKSNRGSSVVAVNHQENIRTTVNKSIRIHTGTNKIEQLASPNDAQRAGALTRAYSNEAIEVFSSEDEDYRGAPAAAQDSSFEMTLSELEQEREEEERQTNRRNQLSLLSRVSAESDATQQTATRGYEAGHSRANYLAMQQVHWAARRTNALSLARLQASMRERGPYEGLDGRSRRARSQFAAITKSSQSGGLVQWWKTLLAVTWKNYVRLRRNPPVLVFQFMLPAIQVILFCLCIGGEPFDVPLAIVNEEQVPKSSLAFLGGLNKKIIRQVKYDNLTSAMEAVRRGHVWGALHIPDKYSENLQARLILGEEVNNETISNGTIRVYPDLTNLHLAMTLETTFRETFLKFARDSIEEMGYDRSIADLPIQVAEPIYGSMRKDGYLEFMAPGVVISISYVMATGLTALAFILERRDGLLERSLVSGVQTSQILLAHAINQVIVMIIQIFLVLACTFFIFEIPSRGPFFWVVLLILLQGCTGMGFGLLVSAICAEENTAVMMVVGTFYTNLILAGIIWPIEAMPHWLRPVSYAQPQTLPTESLRHILSRGWGITETGVLIGFAVTIGWLVVFLMAAGIIFKYSR